MNIDPVGICWLGGVIYYSLQRDISVSNSKTALYVGFRYFHMKVATVFLAGLALHCSVDQAPARTFHDKGSLLENC